MHQYLLRDNMVVHPGVKKHDWARHMLKDAPVISFPNPHPHWIENPRRCEKLEAATTSQRKHLQLLKLQHTKAWIDSWMTYPNRVIEPSIAQAAPLDKKWLKIHLPLKKAESALATQIRTGKIGLADFSTNFASQASLLQSALVAGKDKPQSMSSCSADLSATERPCLAKQAPAATKHSLNHLNH